MTSRRRAVVSPLTAVLVAAVAQGASAFTLVEHRGALPVPTAAQVCAVPFI